MTLTKTAKLRYGDFGKNDLFYEAGSDNDDLAPQAVFLALLQDK